eukprot:TRINITY_DN1164_c0_g1_i4.p1 TRINITY_DN1164_c0_g1~~TRINITY_DN1164_c0_g1_i4.p1  ORF type:complete len:569 (+),score=122.99 TRINITY_DN1164_c0_g1_i4:218-1924(+)
MENIFPSCFSGVCEPEFFEFRALLLMFILKNFCIIQDKDKDRLRDFMSKIQVNGTLTFNPIPIATSPQSILFEKSLSETLSELGDDANSYFEGVSTGLKQPPPATTTTNAPKSNILRTSLTSLFRNFEPPPDPVVNSRYLNEFDELGFIGKGGFGSVVKARNKIDGSIYAIKKIKFRDFPLMFNDGATRKKKFGSKAENVLREVTALAKLDHPNVARYYAAWIEKDCSYPQASSSQRNYFFSQPLTLPYPRKRQSSDGDESSIKNAGSNRTSFDNTNTFTKNFITKSKSKSTTKSNSNNSKQNNNSNSKTKISNKENENNSQENEDESKEDNSEDENSTESDGDDDLQFGDNLQSDPKILKEPPVMGKLWQGNSSLSESQSVSVVNNDTTNKTVDNEHETSSITELSRSNTFSLIPYVKPRVTEVHSLERSHSSPLYSAQSPPTPPQSSSKDKYVLYIQMQLYSALTLKDFLEQPDRVVDRQHNLFLLRQLIDGLHHIHSRKFIHRDLKPANIFIDSEGGLRIGDFGLSKEFWGNVEDGSDMSDFNGFSLSGNSFFQKRKNVSRYQHR